MSEIISFLVSVLASVVGYYICKWLDGDRKHININMLNKKLKKKKMYKIHKNKNCGENRVIRIKNIIIA